MKKILLILITILLCLLIYIFIDYNVYMDVNIVNNTVNINTYHRVGEFIDKVTNAQILEKDKIVYFDKVGQIELPIKIKNNFGKIYNNNIVINVIDNEKPQIECSNIESYIYDSVNFSDYVNVSDNSNEEIIPRLYGNYDINKQGVYDLSYFATDSSGNTSECTFKLTIKDKMAIAETSADQYYLRLNKSQNVLMVYSLDTNGHYGYLVKTFVISAGNNTPVGVFKIKDRHEYISFPSGTYGRYGIRINGHYWFHSVPYNSLPNNGHWDNISTKEYNKLGSLASAGCIRMQVSDVKWLYDNIPEGTVVNIFENDNLPEGIIKPEAQKIDINSSYKGWDPTDSDSSNPWKNN